uniref:PKD domain-containing protein n=1 Tax=Roseihalotalea indica TaxID=2867963 RepID=A0AA49JEV1_9BACT|nr:PKD domain-containing protein [Tunicatimonas sp. TK19036]
MIDTKATLAVIELDSIKLDSYEILENRDPGNGGIGVGDFLDDQNGAILYELVPGAGSQDNGAFRILRRPNRSQLLATQMFDFETKNTYYIRVRATQDGSIENQLIIRVKNVLEPPTDITLSSNTVEQQATPGTTVGTLAASGGAPVSTYTLVNGDGSTDNEVFTIDSTTLKTAAGFGSKTIYSIRVQGSGDGTYSKILTVTATPPPNQPPVANAGQDQTVIDADRNGTEAVTLNGSASADPDNNIASYSWQENNTEIATGVNPTVNLSVGVHTITLIVTDDEGETASDQVTITVNAPENLPPVADAGLDQAIIDEDRNGEALVSLDGSASSDDDGTIVNYSWQENNVEIAKGVQITTTLSVGSHTITLIVTDDDGDTASDQIVITINEAANQPPIANAGPDQRLIDNDRDGVEMVTLDGSDSSDPDGSITRYQWKENNTQGTILAEGESASVAMPLGDNLMALVVEDNDGTTASDAVMIYVDAPPLAIAGDPQTITDENGDGSEEITLDGSGSSDVDGTIAAYEWTWDAGSSTGVRTKVAMPTGKTTQVTLTVTDDEGLSHSDDTSVTVNAPAAATMSLNKNTVLENKDPGTKVGDLNLEVDGIIPEFGVRYSLPDEPADNQLFAINDNDLVTAQRFDYETKQTYNILVKARYSVIGQAEEEFVITVENEEEPPSDIELTSTNIDENKPVGNGVGDFPEDGGAVTYTLVSGDGSDGNEFFQIARKPNRSQLQTNAIFDYEAKSSYTIRVRADNGDGIREEIFTITVVDVNETPVANAGPDQTVVDEDRNDLANIMLDGSASSDPENNIATYNWSWSGGSATGVRPQITLPVGRTTITLRVTDTGSLSSTDEVIINVNPPANQPPVANAGQDQTVIDADRNGTEAVTLNGSASADPDNNIASYSWQENNTEIATGVNPTVNLSVGVHTITLIVTDDEGETASDQVTITVNAPANQLPTANAGPDQTVVDENGDNIVSVTLNGSASSDPDGNITTYSWREGGSEIATGPQPQVNLTVGTHTIVLTVTDNVGATASDEVIITVNGPAQPTISLTNAEVQENREAGTNVGEFNTSSAITLAYSLPNNQADNEFFRIENGNELVTDAVFDRETKASYTIRVTATYAIGSVQQDFTITILNVEEKPTNITLDKNTIPENQANATVGTFQTVGGQGPFTYTLTGSNNDNNLFSIDGNQLKTQSGLNFEADSSLEIEVTSTNDGSFTKKFTITVTNVEEPPTDILLTSNTVNENEPRNTVVGTLSVTGGASVPVSYQFVSGENDNASFLLDEKKLLTNAVFDREVKSSYKVQIRAIGDGSFTKTFTITITNVNDAPVINITQERVIFAEGGAPIKILPDITVSDIDNAVLNSATLTFGNNYVEGEDELVGGTWNAEAGTLTINGPIAVADLQSALRNVTYKNNKTVNPTSTSREIRVVVNDGALDSNTERVFVLVDNPNVPPMVSDFELETPEDQPLTLTAEDFEANYEDADSDLPNEIYLLSAPSNGILAVDGQIITNAIIVSNRPRGFLVDFDVVENFIYTPLDNFNGTDNFRWNVRDNDNAGNEAQVNIIINPVNDAPSISAPIQLSTQEAAQLALNGISYEDPDNDALSLTLAVTNGFFIIDSSVSESISILDEDENGVKRIQAQGSATDITAIMAGLAYISSDTPETSDQLQITLTDSPSNRSGAFTEEATVNIVITPKNDAPVLSNLEESPLMYTENSEPMLLTETLEISDEENNAILAATLTIIDGEAGDELIFNSTQSIQSTFANSELLLQGEASLEDYQAALRAVLFVSANNNPSDTPRQIQIQVNDANNGMSNVVTRTVIITPVDDTTVIEQVDDEIFYIIGESEITPFTNGLITDPDDDTLTSLIVQFENDSFVPGTDSLGLTQIPGLSIEWNEETGMLTITGEADLATYQSALQTIVYQYTGTDEAVKTLSVTATTSGEVSSSISQQIRIIFNQPPQLSNIEIPVNSGQVYSFSEDDFLSGYSDPDNFPTTDGFEAIRITSLPETGQLRLRQESVTQDQLGANGLVIARDDIPLLSYVMTNNETTSDSFAWNATDGAEFAEQDATVTFTINLLSVTIGSESEEICSGESATLTATVEGGEAPFTYEWTCDLADCAIISENEEVAVVSPEESSNYQVTITDANGMQTSNMININVAICNLVIPSGFTPNGDNINDTWQLQNIGTFENRTVEVYDRYGHRVFYSDNYTSPWNGEYKGKKLPTGTYYYRIELDGGAQSYQGKVTILQ